MKQMNFNYVFSFFVEVILKEESVGDVMVVILWEIIMKFVVLMMDSELIVLVDVFDSFEVEGIFEDDYFNFFVLFVKESVVWLCQCGYKIWMGGVLFVMLIKKSLLVVIVFCYKCKMELILKK